MTATRMAAGADALGDRLSARVTPGGNGVAAADGVTR